MLEWGHEVRVVTADISAVQGFYDFGMKRISPSKEIVEGVEVERLAYAGYLYQIAGWVNDLQLPLRLGSRLAMRIVRLLRARFRHELHRAILDFRPDVVMTMPHLVVNVQGALMICRQLNIALVMVPMLHEEDPNWEIEPMIKALANADAVVAMTPLEVCRLVDSYAVPREKIFLGGVGVDVADITEVTSRSAKVVFLGRQAKSKGIDILLDAMQVVWRERPDADLWLVGAKVPETEEIKRKINRLPEAWRHRVKDCGSVSPEERDRILATARCLVLPSKSESFGIVLLEAWGQATPVITWDLPLFRSIIDQGLDGLLVEVGDHQIPNLAKAILNMLNDTEMASHMGWQGYQKAKDHYNWQAVAKGYEKAYRNAIEYREKLNRKAA